jgi:hypothetical protein
MIATTLHTTTPAHPASRRLVSLRFGLLMTGILPALLTLVACDRDDAGPGGVNYTYTFEADAEGWQSGFADYPVGEESFFELESGWSALPAPLDGSSGSFRISGNNHSDDLFMYLWRRIDGLEPGREYTLTFDIELASNAPQSSVGIGGSPGASVYLKAGATAVAPDMETDQYGWYQVNFDKGNQAQGGSDMAVLGTVGTDLADFTYTLIRRGNQQEPFRVTAGSSGSLWLLVGSDSGFEGTTTLYYNRISVTLR